MQDLLGFAPVAAITIICYLVAMGVKVTKLPNKYLPLLCGCCGAVLGVIAMYLMPNYPAANMLDAIAYGIVSGLAATGINQVIKQTTKEV